MEVALSGGLYKAAGVDIDAKYSSVVGAKAAIRRTFTPGVMSDIGLFGGLFDLDAAGVAGQVLVASTDGVGTKTKIAARMQRYDSVGRCLVNHSINDVLVQGARPLFFLDYVGTGRLDPEVVTKVIEGVAEACRETGCALLGGETAEMPGMYPDGDFEIVGTIVGSVARERILDGKRVRAGDEIIALRSSGLHTNGYSLARKILDDAGVGFDATPDALGGQSVGDALLAVHLCYANAVLPILEHDDAVHACAHITGGGLFDNLPRVLPEGLGAEIEKDAVEAPAIFSYLRSLADIPDDEAYRVFNMGFGFLLVVDSGRRDDVMAALREGGEDPKLCGRIVEGEQSVRLV